MDVDMPFTPTKVRDNPSLFPSSPGTVRTALSLLTNKVSVTSRPKVALQSSDVGQSLEPGSENAHGVEREQDNGELGTLRAGHARDMRDSTDTDFAPQLAQPTSVSAARAVSRGPPVLVRDGSNGKPGTVGASVLGAATEEQEGHAR